MPKKSFLNIVKDNSLILLILLLGLLLRIYDLGTESVWYDEAISIAASKLGIIDQITWNIAQNESNPPFYYLVLHFWVPVFGDSEFISRLPSAIFGSLSVFAIYAVGKLIFNKKAGLLAALILAVSVFHIQYSQEARAYSLMVLLTLISFYFLLKLTSSRRRAYSIAYVVSSVLLMYTHYYGALIMIVQNVFYFTMFLVNKKAGELGIWRWLKLQLLLGLLFLPGFLLWAKVTLFIQKGFWVPEPTFRGIMQYFTFYAGSLYLLILFVIFSFLSVISFRKVKDLGNVKEFFNPLYNYPDKLGIKSGNIIYLLVLWLFIPIVLPYIISLVSTPVLIFRYTICASLAFYLLASRGIGNTNNKWIILFISVLVIVLSLVNVEKYYARVDKRQWREAMSDIETNANYGDIIVVYPKYEIEPATYYSKRKDLKIFPLSNEFITYRGLGDRNVWIIISANQRMSKNRIKLGLIERYDFISEKQYNLLDVYQLRERRS